METSEGSEWSASCPGRFISNKEQPVTFEGWVWMFREEINFFSVPEF